MTNAVNREGRVALAALFGGAVAIAFAPIFVRLSPVSPVATAFWRLLLAQPFLWLWRAAETRRPGALAGPVARRDYLRLLGAGLLFAGDLAIWHWSIKFTSVANSTLLANFAPIVVALETWLLLGQRIRRAFTGSMALALCGLVLLVHNSAQLGADHLKGDALAVVTAFFYGSYLFSVSRLRGDFTTATIMTWSGAVSTVALLLMALLTHETIWPPHGQGWWVLIALALLVHIGGQSLIAYALAHVPATFSALGLLVQPVAAALLAWLILREGVGPWQAMGGALVLTGIFVARRESRAAPPVDPSALPL